MTKHQAGVLSFFKKKKHRADVNKVKEDGIPAAVTRNHCDAAIRRGLILMSIGSTVFCLALSMSSLAGPESSSRKVRLIAHRGGVVDESRPENSSAALQAAIERGYWMVEVDVRESKDGRLVMQHDATFHRMYGDDRSVADMTWDEIRNLRSKPGNAPPLEFRELASVCRNRMRLMIDTKKPDHPRSFYEEMERALRENGLLQSAFFVGTPESKSWFKGKARVAVNRGELRQAVMNGEAVGKLYFLFEHGNILDSETVKFAEGVNVPVVASVNRYHYQDDDLPKAHSDIQHLLGLGVVYFQIDSIYDTWLEAVAKPVETPSGHDVSRADRGSKRSGLQPLRRIIRPQRLKPLS